MMELTTEQIQSIWAVADKMEKASVKVDKLYIAICGDTELKQIGIIEQQEKIKNRLDEIEKILERSKGYLAGAVAVGGVAGSVITLLIKSIFKI